MDYRLALTPAPDERVIDAALLGNSFIAIPVVGSGSIFKERRLSWTYPQVESRKHSSGWPLCVLYVLLRLVRGAGSGEQGAGPVIRGRVESDGRKAQGPFAAQSGLLRGPQAGNAGLVQAD